MPTTDVIQTIAIVFTFFLIVYQNKVLSNSLKANITASLAERLDEINKYLMDHPEMYADLGKPYPGGDKVKRKDPRPILVDRLINLHNEVFDNNKLGLIDKVTWAGWQNTLEKNIKLDFFAGHWKEEKGIYAHDFQMHVDEMIEKLSSEVSVR